MSFGGGGGFFGQNNANQSSGFGGFGAANNNTASPGFGAANTNAFGAANTSTTGGGMFGGGTGSFGASTGGGFGQASSGFGAKPAFGSTATSSAGGGLFGASTTATAGNTGGFGGFGATNTASTSTPFGGGSSLFGGANKPASTFGSTTTPAAGSSLFGGSGGGFGTAGATGFGATNNPGIGVVGDPPGTAQVPFNPTVEKEANNPSQSNSYQNILFMDPYKKWSAEELRLVDYTQGRRHGNASGAGAFGVSSGFGNTGFGATNTTAPSTGFGATTNTAGNSMFGNTQPASTGFGAAATNTTGGFGSGAGGLFGAAKPAGTGLFANTAQQPAQQTGGGLFGNSGTSAFGNTANTGSGFGAATNNTAGTGLFGQTATQNKPAGFSFGNTGATTGGFGATNTSNAFGASTNTANTGTGIFGNTTTQQPAAAGGLFGNTAQQNATPGFGTGNAFGAQNQPAGSSLFNQNKPATGGLFGNTNTQTTGTGIFGSGTNASNPFGGATNTSQAQGGGIFGNKPATTGTGMFGNTQQQTGNTGTGLFGALGSNTQTQQPAQGGGIFGGLGQTQQQKPSPFGTSMGQSTGGGLFAGLNTQQSTGGMFGNSSQQQQGGLGGSMFGASQNNQAPQSLNTSINDISAYGSASLFGSLGNNEAQNPGPLATPLSGNKNKVKSRSILPMYKLSPANASRFVTPQKRGFGFSYSTYGTPSSVSSVASTPGGLGQSLLMGSNNNRGLSKSISTSSLRRSFNVEDSILSPGAFSASSGPRFAGGHKKLVINKDMRSDLFSSPTKARLTEDTGARKIAKRVSFDKSVTPAIENGSQESPKETPEPSSSSNAQDLGYLRPSTNGVNGSKSSSSTGTPEMEQVKGKELAIVHEEEPAAPPAVRVSHHLGDNEPGEYWMSPSKETILSMNRMQRQKVLNFAVGRECVGSVTFKIAVDLSNIDLDQLYGNIVILEPRSATVYPIAAKKPPVGKGLNVPAEISLEQSWPRARDKKTTLHDKSNSRFAKHIERLKRIEGTTFVDYNNETGVWTFSVEHFTTYGLDDSDEEDETEAEVMPPTAPVTKDPTPVQARENREADVASPDVDPDDTFEFKRSRRPVPGAFDGTALSDDEEMVESDQLQRVPYPELEEPDMHPQYDGAREEQDDESMDEGYEAEGGELVRVPSSMEVSVIEEEGDYQLAQSAGNDQQVPAGIMRARMRAMKKSTAPTKIQVAGGDDWTQILQQSVRAPRRMDRATLRALNESGAAWEVEERGISSAPKQQNVSDGAGFATSIDLMKSLFEQTKGPAQSVGASSGKGFVKWPYQRREKLTQETDELELAWRGATRVEWGPRGTTVVALNDVVAAESQIIIRVVEGDELSKVPNMQAQMRLTEMRAVNGVPTVISTGPVTINSFCSGDDQVWELASVLFDNDGADLSSFWQRLVDESTDRSIAAAATTEEKALVCLAGNRVTEACKYLITGKNFRLATSVAANAATGSSLEVKRDIRQQLKNWQESKALSEFSEPIRAIWEILAGNTCVCDGMKNVPIENRVESFFISERFNLDWMQAFGLCLWQGRHRSVADAVRAFKHDIEQGREEEPDSPLWGLLKLFADEEVNYSDYRLDWPLTRALYSSGRVSFGRDAHKLLDEMTASFAAQLDSKGEWVGAMFVLVHLSNPAARTAALREQLGRHAHLIDDKDEERTLSILTQQFKIPAAWIWEAKALHARSVMKDAVAEFAYLLLAKDFQEANRTFLKRVAPTAIIERKYKDLFEYAKLLYHIRDQLPDYSSGAGVYLYFLATRNWDEPQLPGWTERLTQGLRALRAATRDDDVLEVAAIADMAEDLVKVGVMAYRAGGDAKLYKLASSLPLTEDRRQKYLKDLVFEGMAQVGVH